MAYGPKDDHGGVARTTRNPRRRSSADGSVLPGLEIDGGEGKGVRDRVIQRVDWFLAETPRMLTNIVNMRTIALEQAAEKVEVEVIPQPIEYVTRIVDGQAVQEMMVNAVARWTITNPIVKEGRTKINDIDWTGSLANRGNTRD